MAAMAVVVAIAAMGAGVAGCAPTATATFSSTVDRPKIVPVERVLVVAGVRSWEFQPALYGDFQRALTERLTSCGVTSRIWYINPNASDEPEHFRNDLRAFQPSVVLHIKDTEDYSDYNKRYMIGKMLNASMSSQVAQTSFWAMLILAVLGGLVPHYSEIKMFFTLTVFDTGSAMTVWQARSEFNFVTGNGLVNDWKSINILATGIVAQLRNDGVLKGCPASWPQKDSSPCDEDRARALRAALVLTDERDRAQAIAAAPTCE
jgi:hypothetical protein